MRRNRSTHLWSLAVVAAVAAPVLTVLTPMAAHAADSDIVISELMYHAPDPEVTEFIELANRGTAPVDISGWSFTAGITIATGDFKFPSGTVVQPNTRIVGTTDQASFHARYGSDADFSYAGSKLSNSGEEVTLVNAGGTVVDDLTYGITTPWPADANGLGPSLELKDLNADNSLASNWAASSTPYGTPRAVNTAETSPSASITNVATVPVAPAPNTPFQVVATIAPGASATVTYKVQFGSDVTIPMSDAAAGGANDGVFGATIPGVAKENLVRYKVNATVGSQSLQAPSAADEMHYFGVVVKDPNLGAQYPVIRWYMTDADYAYLTTPSHICDGTTKPVVISFGDQVIDNAQMRTKGQGSCADKKLKWDISLPSGHLISFGGAFTYPVDEFAFNSRATPVPGIAWETNRLSGDPSSVAYQMMRTQSSVGAGAAGTQFFSVVELIEKYDNQWRDHHGYSNWAMYKIDAGSLRTYPTAAALAASGDIDKKSPDDGDYTDIWQLTQQLSAPDSPAKRAWMYANLDIPEMVNFMALSVVYRNWDSGGKNFYLVHDTAGTGRWRILHWDLDGVLSGGSDTKGDFVVMSSSNKLYGSLMAVPEIATMHYRRVRSLADQWLTNSPWLGWYDSWTTCCTNDIKLDNQKWGSQSVSGGRAKVQTGITERQQQIAKHTKPGEIPTSQSANPNIVITEFQYAPTNPEAEYMELYNPSATESVDLSGWVANGVGTWTIPYGTVLGPKQYGVLVKNDAVFKSVYGGNHFVIGQYTGSLSDSGEPISITAGARTVDAVTYATTAPWPVFAAGSGPSIELKDPALDNSVGSSWQASSGTGSPAAPGGGGGGGGSTTTVLNYGATWRYLATGGDQGTAWRASAFDDSAWPSGAANLGFKNANTTTIPAADGRVTYYFRTTVTVPAGGPITDAKLSLVRDDGAVVYVNGTEVARSNMPTGTVGFTTKALVNTSGSDETTADVLTIPAASLSVGTNVIAVEVHQKATGISTADLSLDAKLDITR